MNFAQITFGSVTVALSFTLFFIPCGIAPGGFTGLATIINHLTGFPIGVLSLCLNIPLFLISFKYEGRDTFIRSLYAMVMLSVFLDLLPEVHVTDDLFLGAVMGGAVMGFGLGLVIRGQATTGGTDMTAKLLSLLLKNAIGIGAILFALDVIIVGFSGLVYGISRVLYAFIAIFVSSRIIDTLQEGLTSAKMVFIISQRPEEIASVILHEMERGATFLNGKGAYSGAEKNIIMCVVSRFEVVKLKQIVHQLDSDAFVIVNDSREIMGYGFTRELVPVEKAEQAEQ
ncbi:MAG: YitT family protein [Christensenellales bacterium]